jgi:hypothetical protein
MRLILLISLFIGALQADPITVVEIPSVPGPSLLSYSYSVPTAPAMVTADILAEAGPGNPVTVGIDLTMDLYTAGPVREGVARLALEISSCCLPYVTARIGGAIGAYSLNSCPVELDCIIDGLFPFELGVPFTINLSGLATDGGFSNAAQLQLYEVPPGGVGQFGAPVQILIAPEPGSAGLEVTGLFALILLAFGRRRKLRSLWIP